MAAVAQSPVLEIAALARDIVGPDWVVTDGAQLRVYECDGLKNQREVPGAVVLPGTTEQVAAVVRLCHERGVPFVARGAGSGLSGGAMPTAAGIIIGLSRLREVLDIAGDVDGQIYMRDFKLIDQSDMIVSLVPELPNGTPGLSSGVERELQHAWEHTKEVYVVWKPRKAPSPFITETATKIFPTVDAALAYFESKGMFHPGNLFGH